MNAPFEKRRKWQKLTLITLAVVVTAVALFYLEEDWRGKRAWEKCKTELAAKGIELDWNKLIPPAVPDDQNFFMASTNILIRFKKAQTEAEGEAARKSSWLKTDFNFPTFNNSRTNPLTIATITVLPPESAKAHHGPADQVVMLGASQTSAQIETALRKTLGRSVLGVAGFNFSECQLSNLAPSQIWLGSDTTPGIADLAKLVPESFDKNLGRLQVAATDDPQKFNVWLIDAKVTSVADYLKWSDQFGPAFDELREALKRPAAVLPGDYAEPYLTPIPNFVTVRALVLTP